jgi:TPR repeat protein
MPIVVLLVAFVVILPTPAHADFNDDFAACRRTILQIGSDPRSPAEQYCLGLSHAFALNHKKDRAQAAKWFRKAAEQNHAAALLRARDLAQARNPTPDEKPRLCRPLRAA